MSLLFFSPCLRQCQSTFKISLNSSPPPMINFRETKSVLLRPPGTIETFNGVCLFPVWVVCQCEGPKKNILCYSAHCLPIRARKQDSLQTVIPNGTLHKLAVYSRLFSELLLIFSFFFFCCTCPQLCSASVKFPWDLQRVELSF